MSPAGPSSDVVMTRAIIPLSGPQLTSYLTVPRVYGYTSWTRDSARRRPRARSPEGGNPPMFEINLTLAAMAEALAGRRMPEHP
jgi:hypothetical protein